MPSQNNTAINTQDSQLMELQHRVEALEATVAQLTRIQVDPAAGGGLLIMADVPILRITSLTPQGAQLP